MKKKILIIVAILFLVLEIIGITGHLEQPQSEVIEFSQMTNPTPDIDLILDNSCYDCHSDYINYPWYSYIAPMSNVINHHIDEGRSHLNFSQWSKISIKEKIHKLEEMIEEIEEDKMPLWSYTLVHDEAILDKPQKEKLIAWIEKVKSIYELEISLDTD